MKLIVRTPKTQSKDWLAGLDWSEFWRCRTNHKSPHTDSEIASRKVVWCRENVRKGEWVTSPGREVFYFLRAEDAAAFKLRWEGYHDHPAV
jgi:hypothetical protein